MKRRDFWSLARPKFRRRPHHPLPHLVFLQLALVEHGVGLHGGMDRRVGPPRAVKWATAQFFNKEAARRKARKHKMYGSVREALNPKKPK